MQKTYRQYFLQIVEEEQRADTWTYFSKKHIEGMSNFLHSQLGHILGGWGVSVSMFFK